MPAIFSYDDRFGHGWRVKASRAANGDWSFVFTHEDIRLLTAAAKNPDALTDEDVRDLFCDAERVLESDGETWYVGYRQRTGGRGKLPQGSLCTRFRSEGGEIRYTRHMLDFRHMASGDLRDALVKTRATLTKPAAQT